MLNTLGATSQKIGSVRHLTICAICLYVTLDSRLVYKLGICRTLYKTRVLLRTAILTVPTPIASILVLFAIVMLKEVVLYVINNSLYLHIC